MTQTRRKHPAPWGSMPAFSSPRLGRFAVALTAATLLLCHGAFGSLHLIPDPALQPNLAGEHATMHPSATHPATGHEERPEHHADAEYFAVLIGPLLGALYLWLLLLNDRRDETSHARRFVASPPATVFNLPRGPTLPFFQVLRL